MYSRKTHKYLFQYPDFQEQYCISTSMSRLVIPAVSLCCIWISLCKWFSPTHSDVQQFGKAVNVMWQSWR